MLELIIINALFIIGLYEATEERGVLAKLHDWTERFLPEILYKPLLGCVYCMASLWGTLFYGLYLYVEFYSGKSNFAWYKLLYLPFYVGAVSGLTFLLYQIILHQKNKSL